MWNFICNCDMRDELAFLLSSSSRKAVACRISDPLDPLRARERPARCRSRRNGRGREARRRSAAHQTELTIIAEGFRNEHSALEPKARRSDARRVREARRRLRRRARMPATASSPLREPFWSSPGERPPPAPSALLPAVIRFWRECEVRLEPARGLTVRPSPEIFDVAAERNLPNVRVGREKIGRASSAQTIQRSGDEVDGSALRRTRPNQRRLIGKEKSAPSCRRKSCISAGRARARIALPETNVRDETGQHERPIEHQSRDRATACALFD